MDFVPPADLASALGEEDAALLVEQVRALPSTGISRIRASMHACFESGIPG